MSAPSPSEGRRYHVIEALGRGGFGTVYRAELESAGGFKKPVALKVLNANMDGMADIVNRLRDEARMLGLLQHRAIVSVDGLVFLDGRWTVVMEYVPGVSMAQVLEQHRAVPTRVALAIIEEVASALHSAFSRAPTGGQPLGLLHRDIKPANIQLTGDGVVKLLDFGVARANFTEREAKTERMIFGSLPYMAPERFERRDCHGSDVYALCATLAELLTGEPLERAALHPDRFAEQLDALLREVQRFEPDDEVSALIRDGLRYDAEDRPTAREVESRARALRDRIAGPRLQDWAEENVPPLLAGRSMEQDELTGSTLLETSGAHAPRESSDTSANWLEDDPSKASLPPQPAPKAAPKAAPNSSGARRARRAQSSSLRGCFLYLSAAVGVLLVLGLLMFLSGVGGCAAMCAPLWGEAVHESKLESALEYQQRLEGMQQSAPRDALIGQLQIYRTEVALGKISFFEMIRFESALDTAMQDGRITDSDVQHVQIVLDLVTPPASRAPTTR